MGIIQFVVSVVIWAVVVTYTFNFARWLVQGKNLFGGIGAAILLALSGAGTLTYLVTKLMS